MRNWISALAVAATLFVSLAGCGPSKIRVLLPPPAARIETRPEAPSAEHAFIPGDWSWDNEKEAWAWRPGYYAKRPAKATSYQRGRWVKRGYSYLFIPGKWLF